MDRKPGNALKTARLEDELGIKATYFFRTIPHTFKPEIIKEIADLGHEIGYHYENLSEVSKKNPQISQINADEGEKDFLWKARMNRMNPFGGMIRMVGWKQLSMERGKGKEETAKRKQQRGNRIEKIGMRKEEIVKGK